MFCFVGLWMNHIAKALVQAGGITLPDIVGFTLEHSDMAVPLVPMYLKFMFDSFTFLHGYPRLHTSFTATRVVDVPTMFLNPTSLIATLDGIYRFNTNHILKSNNYSTGIKLENVLNIEIP